MVGLCPAGGLWRTSRRRALDGHGGTATGLYRRFGHRLSPYNPDRMWIATGDGDFGDTRSIGIWTSSDGGLTWEATGLDWGTNMGRTLTRILVHPNHPDTLWTASSLGVYRSINGGENWIGPSPATYASLEIDPSDPEHLLLRELAMTLPKATTRGPLGGQQPRWHSFGISRITLAFAPSAPDTVYAVAGKNNDQGFAGFLAQYGWRLKLDGPHARKAKGPTCWAGRWTVRTSGGQAWYDLALGCSPRKSQPGSRGRGQPLGSRRWRCPMAMRCALVCWGDLPICTPTNTA